MTSYNVVCVCVCVCVFVCKRETSKKACLICMPYYQRVGGGVVSKSPIRVIMNNGPGRGKATQRYMYALYVSYGCRVERDKAEWRVGVYRYDPRCGHCFLINSLSLSLSLSLSHTHTHTHTLASSPVRAVSRIGTLNPKFQEY